MVGAIELLSKLASEEARLAADGDRLSCYARDGVLTAELREGIIKHKRELIELLSKGESRVEPARPRETAPEGGLRPAPPAEQRHVRDLPASQTATEHMVASIWHDVLKLERVGIDEDFFRIGGNSRLAMDLIVATRERLEVELPLRQLFAEPTIRLIAAYIDESSMHADVSMPPADGDERIIEGAF